MAVTKTGGSLTEEQRARFERDGFLVVEDPCTAQLVETVLQESLDLYNDDFAPEAEIDRDGTVFTHHLHGTDKYRWHRVKNAWKIKSGIRSMALAPRVLGIVTELYGRVPMPYQTLNFPIGTEQPPHIDAFFFNSDPPGYLCGVWIALEDMDMENGPLVYYPGSHKLPLPTWDEIRATTGMRVELDEFDSYDSYIRGRLDAFEAHCAHVIKERGLEPAYGTVKKGQGVFWAANLIHGGSPQRDKNRTRHSQVTHYYFEGCRPYGPLNSRNGHHYYEYPEWIREPPPSSTMDALKKVVAEHVPEGATALVVSAGNEELLELEKRRMIPFPQEDDGSQGRLQQHLDDATEQLRRFRNEGAQYAVIPRDHLQTLAWVTPALQEVLEDEHRAILRDGAYAAVYALDSS